MSSVFENYIKRAKTYSLFFLRSILMVKYEGSEENLKIYNEYIELMKYTEMIINKLPHDSVLKNKINDATFDGFKDVISVIRNGDNRIRMKYLVELDIDLKFLKGLVRTAYRLKYIKGKNMEAWSRKISIIGALQGSWYKKCQKQ